MKDPIDDVRWIEAHKINASSWNANVVATPELRLLEQSILRSGWCFPVLLNTSYILIDGFHRWRLAQDSKRILERWGTLIPSVILDIPDDEAMETTIRFMRAKGSGSGVALRVSEVVRRLHGEYGKSKDHLRESLGMSMQELDLLLAGDLLKNRDLKGYRYSKAWVPIEASAKERREMLRRGEAGDEPDAERPSEVGDEAVANEFG